MTGDGTFTITREQHRQLMRDILTGRKRVENEVMQASVTDVGAFDPPDVARWADDGGREP